MTRTLERCLVLLSVSLFALCCDVRASRLKTSHRPEPTTLRLYLLSDVAGGLAPCGCHKDMLGGVVHLAALIESAKKQAPRSVVLASGPLLFTNPREEGRVEEQDLWKAETLSASLGAMGLVAWAPGVNDWDRGLSTLRALAKWGSIVPLSANVSAKGVHKTWVQQVGNLKLGVTGVSAPAWIGSFPQELSFEPTEPALKAELEKLKASGADIRVALVAASRRDALRLAERVPGFDVMLVGAPISMGEVNHPGAPAERVGQTLVITTPNHLQKVGIVDFFVHDTGASSKLNFADATGVNQNLERNRVRSQIAELDARIRQWERSTSGSVKSSDVAARRVELAQLRRDLDRLEKKPPAPSGNFVSYELRDVNESVGVDPGIEKVVNAYYRRVNEHNRDAFKDRFPPPVKPGQAKYVGVGACAGCHEPAVKFWKGSSHASAYETLAVQHKQFNLDCVSCHVTGYEKPGGSTVSHVDGLTDVQCEVCHGPGSEHVDTLAAAFIQRTPDRDLCASQCHHPPHVPDGWDANHAWTQILGEGHGG